MERVFGSKVKVKILRAMLRFSGKTFTARELADLIKVSHTPVLKSMDDLQGMNLITIEKHGTANLLRLNRNSALYNHLKKAFTMETQTIDDLKEVFSDISAVSIALFGSIAKEEDIDLLVISNNKRDARNVLIEKQEHISKTFGNVLRPYIITEKEFRKKRNSRLIMDIIKNHIMVKGARLE
ncbi:MAG: nucleotidyltransferase domain-containing protein [Candidatus Woesearchaeota archaeon]|nr:nucleotidyltransferase domain-containing protein [Candidatus Woesearchaeota archaeon]